MNKVMELTSLYHYQYVFIYLVIINIFFYIFSIFALVVFICDNEICYELMLNYIIDYNFYLLHIL